TTSAARMAASFRSIGKGSGRPRTIERLKIRQMRALAGGRSRGLATRHSRQKRLKVRLSAVDGTGGAVARGPSSPRRRRPPPDTKVSHPVALHRAPYGLAID